MKITKSLLVKLHACRRQVELFDSLFPEGVVPTVELAREHGSKFNIEWAARYLLKAEFLAEYEAKYALISAEYEAKHAPISAEYEAKRAPISAEYEAKRAPISAE